MKFTQVPADAFQKLTLNAGVLLSNFNPGNGQMQRQDIIGATSGGVSFTAVPTYQDFGEDIDNVPANTKELKKIDSWEVKLSGSFVSADTKVSKMLCGAADVVGDKVTPRSDVVDDDFADIWWVGDYSDKNGDTNGGFVAVRVMDALSTGGFSLQSSDKAKGTYAFELTGHYTMEDIDRVPFEVYMKAGTNESAPA